MTSRSEGVWARARTVLWRHGDEEVVLLPPDEDDAIVIGGAAALLWDLLETPRSLGDAAEVLEGAHAVSRDTVNAQLEQVLDELHRRGVLTCS